MSAGRRPRRKVPSWWMMLVLLVPVALMVWVAVADSAGDRGVRNANIAMLVILDLIILGVWFVFFSGYSRWLRFLTPVALVAAWIGFFSVFDVAGFSGSMIPRLVRRGRPEAPLPRAGPATGPPDLSVTSPADFPGFLGMNRDGRVDGASIDADWTARPPQPLWRQAIGAGWSGFAVVNGVAVTMEQRGEDEAVTAYAVATGELLWMHTHPGRFAHVLGGIGPRGTPLVDEGRVYALGAGGRLVCLDGSNGAVIWEKDLLAEYGVSPEQEMAQIQYGRSNSPLVHDDLLIIPAGGNKDGKLANLAAYDKRTGELRWEGSRHQVSFASPSYADLAGSGQILIVNEDTLSGHDPADGSLLWEHSWPGVTAANASASQAVPVPPDRVFVSKGYGGGGALLRLEPDGEHAFTAQQLWHDGRVMRTKLTNVVIHGDHIYGLSDGILECIELESGHRVWKRGRYGHGQILLAGRHLLVLTEDGEVVLIDPRPDEPARELGRFQALEGQTWNHFALAGDLLVVRNAREAAVYRLPIL